MPQLPQISRDVLRTIFRTPESLRAYEALQQALITTPDDIVTLTAAVGAARDQAEAAIARAAGAQQQAQRAITRPGFGLRSTPDAGGQVLDVVPEMLVLALLPFLPRPATQSETPANDTQRIFAARIFGA